MKGLRYSILSGFFASLASLSGKFAMGNDDVLWLCDSLTSMFARMLEGNWTSSARHYPACRQYVLYTRIFFFMMILLINGLMWTTFVKALRYSRTSLEATLTNTAANFFFTAIFSQVLFGEFLTLMWWIGTVLIVVGLLVMHQGNQTSLGAKKRKRL